MADGACLEHPGLDWFATGDQADAVGVCARCPVRDECLTFALGTTSLGVWGATTEAERRQPTNKGRLTSLLGALERLLCRRAVGAGPRRDSIIHVDAYVGPEVALLERLVVQWLRGGVVITSGGIQPG